MHADFLSLPQEISFSRDAHGTIRLFPRDDRGDGNGFGARRWAVWEEQKETFELWADNGVICCEVEGASFDEAVAWVVAALSNGHDVMFERARQLLPAFPPASSVKKQLARMGNIAFTIGYGSAGKLITKMALDTPDSDI